MKPLLDTRKARLKGTDGLHITTGNVSVYGILSCNSKVHDYIYTSNITCFTTKILKKNKTEMKNTQRKGNIQFFHMIRHTYFLPSFKVNNIPEDNLAHSTTNRPKLNYSLPLL